MVRVGISPAGARRGENLQHRILPSDGSNWVSFLHTDVFSFNAMKTAIVGRKYEMEPRCAKMDYGHECLLSPVICLLSPSVLPSISSSRTIRWASFPSVHHFFAVSHILTTVPHNYSLAYPLIFFGSHDRIFTPFWYYNFLHVMILCGVYNRIMVWSVFQISKRQIHYDLFRNAFNIRR